MLCVHVHAFVYPALTLTQFGNDLLAYSTSIRKRRLPRSEPQNGSVAQEAPNLLNQVKVCHLEPIEKLACGMSQ